MFPKGLHWHLQVYHRVPIEQRRLLLQHCGSLDLITKAKDIQLPLDNSPALQFLPVTKGYSCCQPQCRHFSSNEHNMQVHINKAHNLFSQACADSIQSVQLQSWFLGGRAKYWIVRAEAAATPTTIQHLKGSSLSSDSARELERLEQQEIERLEQLEQDFMAQEAELEDSDNSPWLRFTQWPTQFAGLPLDIITASAVQPKKALKSDYILGPWAGEHFISHIEEEIKLQQLMQLLDQMFDRCNETTAATTNLLRC
jgi:hypothetical protein